MADYEFDGVIDENRQLTLPPEIPAGAVHVQLFFQGRPGANGSQEIGLFEQFMGLPLRNRSREDINEYLRIERDSWE